MSLFHKKDTKREVFGQMFTELYPRLFIGKKDILAAHLLYLFQCGRQLFVF